MSKAEEYKISDWNSEYKNIYFSSASINFINSEFYPFEILTPN